MADFRRSPEWQQQADRHSELVDPVLTVRQLGRFDFTRRALRMDHALVFTDPRGTYDSYLPPVRPSRTEVASKRYTSVYEVDMGVHHVRSELSLPSDNDALEFGAEIDLTWQVVDPGSFVRSGHRDVPALLLGRLQQAARAVTRSFAIHQSADAERLMLETMAGLKELGSEEGLLATWAMRLRRDQDSIDHQRRLQAIGHATAEQILAAERGMAYDMVADQRNRQQDRLQIERSAEYGMQQQELALQQQQWEHERAMLTARQQIELQSLEAEKINFYQYYLQQGGVPALALHLAEHPEDAGLVMNNMRDDQLRLIQAQMDMVRELMSGDNAENYELEGPKRLALRTMSDILNQRLPGVPENRQAPGTRPSLEKPTPTEGLDANPPASEGTPVAGSPSPSFPAPSAASPNAVSPTPVAGPTDWQPPIGYGHIPDAPNPPAPIPQPGSGTAPSGIPPVQASPMPTAPPKEGDSGGSTATDPDSA